jgi:pimeloyl-ACP methyl ester carboxylesterase
MTTPRERWLALSDRRMAALEWGRPSKLPTLALHGWLDNAASFARLAPRLTGLHLVAPDLTGHGRSDHHPPGCAHHFIDWVAEVLAVADALEWSRFRVIGHSMGAGIATLLAATASDRIERIVLLEGFGPLSAPAEGVAARLASALADERRASDAPRRVFAGLDEAVEARCRGTDLDEAAARVLVERGVESAEDGVRFRHDQRLKARSRVRLTEPQVLAFLAAIECPVLAVRALDGWPFPAELIRARVEAVRRLELVEIEGGHHVHLTHPERVVEPLGRFLNDGG